MEDNADVRVEIPYGKKFYVFYNSINNLETKMQFIYDPKQKYQKDDKNVVIGHSTENPNGVYNYYINGIEWMRDQDDEEKITPYIKINGTKY
jgi:hypothetical protein